ncbi:MAG: putative dihydrolipoamide acyltransferase component, partial [Frankiales bacterium]|nr:putative dihydrolipoamide acyltransferase component [Frankiales bacterium]
AAGAAANPVESAAGKDARAVGARADVVADTVPRAFEPGIEGSPAPKAAGEGALIGEVGANGRTATLVGPGPKQTEAKRRVRAGAEPAPEQRDPEPARTSAGQVGRAAEVRVGRVEGGVTVLAKPPVRKLARDLGVDLVALTGTGPHGTITRDDVQSAAAGRSDVVAAPAPAAPPAYDPATRERRIPVKGVRKLTAQAMVGSAFSAPHVTEFITLDMTPTMELMARVRALPEFRGVKVTPLLFVAKALLLAVKRNPEINSTFSDDEIVVKDYVNLGIAAATPRGLMVPNVKDADALDLLGLAQALQQLTETAKQGKTSPADMQGGTITITNVGVFGVDNGTPILNPGESAILCFGAVRPNPWVVDDQIVVRQVTQLALSFDHRNVDGQLGSQFLSDVARVLSDPGTALLWA